jgi:hypothetical protein
MQQVPYRELRNIGRQRRQFSRPGDLAPGIWAPLLSYHKTCFPEISNLAPKYYQSTLIKVLTQIIILEALTDLHVIQYMCACVRVTTAFGNHYIQKNTTVYYKYELAKYLLYSLATWTCIGISFLIHHY